MCQSSEFMLGHMPDSGRVCVCVCMPTCVQYLDVCAHHFYRRIINLDIRRVL